MLDRSALIAYGSETGNSQDFAEELGRSLQRIRFNLEVVKLDDIELVSISRTIQNGSDTD